MYSAPYFVIYVDSGGSGPPSSFSLIPTLSTTRPGTPHKMSRLSTL